MARLNEPPLTSDSFELLRLKLKRQNRDLARVNSNQSLRIRQLENECARMLSENLELRGRIIRMEQEGENNKAQRIADHALEIKEKMEAQLVEWGSLLAGLGMEPPRKRRSLDRRMAKPRTSLSNRPSPPQRRPPRELARESEVLAAQEGRLPPIQETKSYPRMSLHRDEIAVLCTESADSTDSPDLGPPPMSRFVDEEPIKMDLPSKPAAKPVNEPRQPKSTTRSESDAPSRETKPFSKEDGVAVSAPKEPRPRSRPVEEKQDPTPAARAGAKRKYGSSDESDDLKTTRPTEMSNEKGSTEKIAIARDRQTPRTLKELTTLRREARERLTASATSRKPLAIKSTNDDVTSPKKSSAKRDAILIAKAEIAKEPIIKAPAKPKRIEPVPTPAPEPVPPPAPVVASIDAESEPAAAEAQLFSPSSPEPLAPEDHARGDTPPPLDISTMGETSRPSRRARAAISYAEPNLRDKMRRPTKELLDAVTGEGKFIRAHPKGEEAHSTTDKPIKRESGTVDSLEALPRDGIRDSASEPPKSPMAASGSVPDEATTHTVTQRRKRSSVVPVEKPEPASKAAELEPDTTADTSEDKTDPYEFTSSSPRGDKKEAESAKEKPAGRRQSKSSRRLSSVQREDLIFEAEEAVAERPKSTKRASMMLPKKTRMDLDEDSEYFDSSSQAPLAGESAPLPTRERGVMRRKSTMT